MTTDAEILDRRIAVTRERAIQTRQDAETTLREAVQIFNAQPLSLSSVDAFRARVILVANALADDDTPTSGSLRADEKLADARLELVRVDEEREVAERGDWDD